MDILCEKNKGYDWWVGEKGFFKGYIQLADAKGGEILEGGRALDWFHQSKDFSEFLKKLSDIYGFFAVIIKKEDRIWAAVDIARTMPLYYSDDCRFLSDSGEKIRKLKKIRKSDVNPIRMVELYATSNIVFENTAYDSVKQIDCGNAIEFIDDKATKAFYFAHTEETKEYTETQALKALEQVTKKVIERTLKYINKRPIVLSLSGGYDSRYLACSLKNAGIDRVICYTYGSRQSRDVKESKLVADALGYDWYCVEYTDQDICRLVKKENEGYFTYCCEHDYTIYLQNYIAVRKLTEDGRLPKDAVFLTGLGNDMPTGVYVPSEETASSYGYSIQAVCDYIIDYRFARVTLREDIHDRLAAELRTFLRGSGIREITDYQSFVNAVDCAQAEEAHSRCYPNMNRIHEYFGYQWVMPCWDKELIRFWYGMPVEFRYKRNLFEKYVTEELGKKYHVGQKRWTAVSQKNQFLYKAKRRVGGILVRILYPLGIPIKRNTDENNFAPLEVLLYRNIRQKKAVKAQRAAITMMLNIYMMEKRYGYQWYRDISRFVK